MKATRSSAPLPKLSRPRLYDPVPRERLFSRLDAAREHPVIWITGPPGAGKTTLMATYLSSRRPSAEIWYQLDVGDNDPASFFYHLNLAERTLPRASRKPPLPLLTGEYLADIPSYARRFMREVFARMPAGSLLVLDNFQELIEHNALHHALAASFCEIPP